MGEFFVCLKCGRESDTAPDSAGCEWCGGEMVRVRPRPILFQPQLVVKYPQVESYHPELWDDHR